MKHILAAALSLTLTQAASAQTFSAMSACLSYNGVCGSSSSDPYCDSKDRTPREALDCKIDYWNKQLADAQKRRDQADQDISHAKERIGAFTAAKP